MNKLKLNDMIQIENGFYRYKKVNIKGVDYFQVRIKCGEYTNGKPKYKTANGKTIEELIERTEKLLKNNIFEGQAITVEKICNEWLQYKFPLVAPVTFDECEKMVRVHIMPYFKNSKASCLTEENMQAFIDYLSVHGNKKSNSGKQGLEYNYLKKMISMLSQICEYAVRKSYIDKNYAKYLSIPRKVKKPKEKEFLDKDGLVRFINELNKKDKKGNYIYYYRSAILFMMYTGLRGCEIFALKKDMVDFENKLIKVERNKIRTKKRNYKGEPVGGYVTRICDETKNKSSKRIVPLCNEALEILKNSCELGDSELCFPNKNGDIVKYGTFIDRFNKICNRASVTITPHSLRHTFASNVYYSSGLQLEQLAKLLGHSTTRVTYDTYLHQDPKKETLIGNSLNNLYGLN